MATRRHVHAKIELPASPERVFALLHTPSAIRGWWSAARAIVLAKEGGTWAATWGESEDDPDHVTVASGSPRLRPAAPPGAHRLSLSSEGRPVTLPG